MLDKQVRDAVEKLRLAGSIDEKLANTILNHADKISSYPEERSKAEDEAFAKAFDAKEKAQRASELADKIKHAEVARAKEKRAAVLLMQRKVEAELAWETNAEKAICPVCLDKIAGSILYGEADWGYRAYMYHPICHAILVFEATNQQRREAPPTDPVVAPVPIYNIPVGCVCPPGAENSCRNPTCGRKPVQTVFTSGVTVDG